METVPQSPDIDNSCPHQSLPGPEQAFDQVGRFYVVKKFENPMCKKRLQEIHGYFTDEKIRDMLLPLINGQSNVSLRDLDWLVTNYAKKHNVVYNWKVTPGDPEVLINVHRQYKTWLPRWRRKMFDSFRRRQRLYFVFDGQVQETTVAQLNFLRWADMYGVLKFVQDNLPAIAADMNQCMQRNRDEPREVGKRRRRRELSKAPTQKCFVYNVTMKVHFTQADDQEPSASAEQSP